MRRFSELEKKAMVLIASQDYSSLVGQDIVSLTSNLLLTELGVKLKVNPDVVGTAGIYVDDPRKSLKALELIISVISLLNYLESNYYVLKHDGFGRKVGSLDPTNTEGLIYMRLLSSPTANDFLINNWEKQVLATEALKELVDNNFKTGDDILLEKQLELADKQLKIASDQLTKSSDQIKWAKWTLISTVIIQAIAVAATILC